MSYQSQALLEINPDFQMRVRSANMQQADIFKDDQRSDFKACAEAVLRDEIGPGDALLRTACASPGIADKVDQGDGTIDQSLVTDADLLSITQANWPTVAALYFNEDGTPIQGA